jgi:glyoxylase-like metal-dependent hydrolase (beta-lactamase superfamily II)
MTKILFKLFIKAAPGLQGAAVENEIDEGDTLPFLPELKILFTPGHSDGHLAYLLERDGGVLFAGDACANMPRLGWSLGYENLEVGKRSLKRLCDCDFQTVVFGHGKEIVGNADERWRKKWGHLNL